MKLIHLIIITPLIFASCNKCVDCETITIYQVYPKPNDYEHLAPESCTTHFEACGSEIKNHHDKTVWKETVYSDTLVIQETSTTNCK